MTKTYLYTIDHAGLVSPHAAFPNAEHFAPAIWNPLIERYLCYGAELRYADPRIQRRKLWEWANLGAFEGFERTCVRLTYDWAMLRREHFVATATDLRRFEERYYDGLAGSNSLRLTPVTEPKPCPEAVEGVWGHWCITAKLSNLGMIALALEELAGSDLLGACFYGHSCGDQLFKPGDNVHGLKSAWWLGPT